MAEARSGYAWLRFLYGRAKNPRCVALRTTTLLALVWSLLYAQTFAQGLAVEKLPGLSAFVDSTMARLMEQEHVSAGL